MPCQTFRVGDSYGIICSPKRNSPTCKYCSRPSSLLCDFPLIGEKVGKTCDTRLCRQCALHREPDKDYCRPHAKMIIDQEAKQMEIENETD